MSANSEEDKDLQKGVPLDLARTQITAVRTVESNKAPLVMTSQALRSVRVLTQNVSSSSNPAGVGQTIITNLVPGAVIKQDSGRTQITGIVGGSQSQNHPQSTAGISVQRPTQITLSATPLVAAQNSTGTTYHVPRGPAVVANLAAPRSNVSTVRTPLVVTAQNSQTHSFVRPPRTPSPAQGGTAWQLATSSNNPQLKVASTVLSSPVRATTITGKPQAVGRPLPNQPIQTVKPTILSNAITIGQTIHSFKPAPGGTMQIGNTVTLAQMLPARTQAVVYSANTANPQFTPTARITVTTTAQSQVRPSGHPRPLGPIVSGARLAVPISQVLAAQNSRLVTASSANLGTNQRISVASISQSQPVLASTTRLVSTQATGNVVGRLAVNNSSTVAGTVTNSSNILTSQARISALSTLNLQSIMVANGNPGTRVQTTQGPKVITQPTATIHLAQIPTELKTTSSGAGAAATRTINVPASIVAQRPGTGGTPQAIPIAKVYTSNDNQNTPGTASVLIHASLAAQAPRHASPGPQQATITSVPSANTPYSLANQETGSYFFENASTASGAFQRTFVSQQAGSFIAQPQQSAQIIKPSVSGTNQQFQGVRLNSVMVVEQSRGQQLSTQFQPIAASQAANEQHRSGNIDTAQHHNSQMTQNKMNSSPRPSILRKRDHEGSPLKAAKNLIPTLQNSSQQQVPHPLASPPSPPRPDSRGNGHTSGGSTTISATSSPGLPEVNDDCSDPAVMLNNLKEDEEEESSKPPMEMSPRKKPRKQQLTGNDDETHDDMQFISESSAVKKENYDSDGPRSDSTPKDGAPEAPVVTTIRKPATASLLNGYRQTWKATHNHYQRYTDVKPKDERRPTIIDLANQNKVLEKVNGWKVYHLSTQMDDLAEQEQGVYDQLTELLKFTESEENSKPNGKEVNRVNELIKGNLQRIKIINDGMQDAKSQIMKVFNHQRHVNDILSRCASKRNFKKREKP
ncbi:histone deacetylase complex subunit SAP130-A [Anthonomus grandis grandis]|uniref:histone deacetylase complex subunit SAP130-A n=1 Tax=Anthonomus grandis grandis TaxID=2921223 RepID=UPI0021663B4A|nr:histone deacetylase complex subunit SAP130-A [Anthonomus grandis grandis]